MVNEMLDKFPRSVSTKFRMTIRPVLRFMSGSFAHYSASENEIAAGNMSFTNVRFKGVAKKGQPALYVS